MTATDHSPRRPGPADLPTAPASPGPARRLRGPRALAAAWLGRLVQWRIRRKGLDLSELAFLPEGARLPLLRNGTDPVPELAELRARCPVQRLDLPYGFAVHLVTGYEQARAVLADGDSYSNDMRHLFRDSSEGSAADVGGLGFSDPPGHTRLRKLVAPEFTRTRLEKLEPRIEAIVAQRLDDPPAARSPGGPAPHGPAQGPLGGG